VIPLTPEVLRLAYRLVCETPPFNKWNLPDSQDVLFVVTRSRTTSGHYRWHRYKGVYIHEIAISARCVGSLATLCNIMAHEIIHLFQKITKTETPNVEHNQGFRRLADEVCNVHHFDRLMFAEID
jgi:hypothetical protein